MPKLYLLFVVGYFGLLFGTVFLDLMWGIYLSIAIYFISPWTKWWGALLPEIRWIMILGVANIVAWAFRTKRYAATRIRDSRQLQYLIAFNVLMVLVGFISVWPERHWELTDKQVKVLIFLLLAYKAIDTPKKFEGLLWTFLGGVFYVAWIAYDTGRTGNGRLEGVGTIDSTDSNDIGAIFSTAVPLLFFYLLEAKRWWGKAIALVCLVFIMNGLILVNSRGAIIGTLAGTGIFVSAILFTRIKSNSFKGKVLAGVLVCFALFIYLADATFWARQGSVVAGPDQVASSDYNRLTIWKYALLLAVDRPLGVGGMGYTILSPTFLPPEVMGDSPLKAIHSTYLEALTAFGWIGAFLFLAIIVSSYRGIIGVQRELKVTDRSYERLQGFALIGGFTAFMVCAIFINRLYCEVLYYFPVFFAIFKNLYGSKQPAAAVAGRWRGARPPQIAAGAVSPAPAPATAPQRLSRSSTTLRKKSPVLKDRAGGP